MITRTWANFHRRGQFTIANVHSMAMEFEKHFLKYPTRVEMTQASINWLLADDSLQAFPPNERTIAAIEAKIGMEVVIDKAVHNDMIKLVLEQEG
jgi:hypothetical protein